MNLLLIAEIDDADHDDDAQAKLDAFREAAQPSAEWGLTLFRPTDKDLEAMGYVPKAQAVKPALSQEIADAINQVIEAAWDDEIERYEEDERPEDHSFEALVILENWLRGTSKTAADFADQAAKEKAAY
jgi:hypothetical protein